MSLSICTRSKLVLTPYIFLFVKVSNASLYNLFLQPVLVMRKQRRYLKKLRLFSPVCDARVSTPLHSTDVELELSLLDTIASLHSFVVKCVLCVCVCMYTCVKVYVETRGQFYMSSSIGLHSIF